MKLGLCPPLTLARFPACQHARHAACRPGPPEPGRGETTRIEGAGHHALRPESAPLQPAHDTARLFGTVMKKRSADAFGGSWMGPAMAPHQEMEIMRAPPAPPRADALAVQGGGKVGIGGHTRPAQLVEQEAKVGRRRSLGANGRFHRG
jgi:hypothetical protein